MEYKTLRYPGHAVIMKAIRDLGLLDLEPITVEGVRVAPRDVFISVVERVLRKPEGRDLVALKVVATGRKAGRSGRVSYQLLDRYDEAHGISAMSRATAYSLSITGQMQVEGRISTPGVHTAYEVTPAAEYVAELGKRGLDIEIRETWDS
jgi:lysine 6-dehydrogenase